MSASLCLIAWNEPIGRPKAIALLRVGACHLEAGLRAADLLEGDAAPRRGRAALDGVPAAGAVAEQLGRRAVERDAGLLAGRVEGLERVAGDARAVEVDEDERGRSLSSRATTIAKSATSPSGTGHFVAAEPCRRRCAPIACGPRIARRPRRGRTCRSPRPRRASAATSSSAPRCRRQQRLGREVDRRGERDRRERAADLLGEHAQTLVAEAGAAVSPRAPRRRASPCRPSPSTARGRRARSPSSTCAGRPVAGSCRRGTCAPVRAAGSGRRKSRSSWCRSSPLRRCC